MIDLCRKDTIFVSDQHYIHVCTNTSIIYFQPLQVSLFFSMVDDHSSILITISYNHYLNENILYFIALIFFPQKKTKTTDKFHQYLVYDYINIYLHHYYFMPLYRHY